MSNSLRDKLLGLGFKPPATPERAAPTARQGRDGGKGSGAKAPSAGRDGSPPQRRNETAPRKAGAPGEPAKRHGRGNGERVNQAPRGRADRNQQDIDLARAYAIRAQKEKDERIEAERVRQEQARARREAKAKLTEMIQGKALNDETAEIARHFEYGGKIKRIYVTPTQLQALNAGELGVVQNGGRYLLVSADTLAEAEAIFEPAVALKVDPNAAPSDDPYADPAYQVPDDLVW